MASAITSTYHISPDDFTRAGEASSNVKSKLKQMGVSPEVARKIAITMYEGEISMVIHAGGGDIMVEIPPQYIRMVPADKGPGIPDVDQAIQAGWSTAPDGVRPLGFGAGTGLFNTKKYTDIMKVDTVPGVRTATEIAVNL